MPGLRVADVPPDIIQRTASNHLPGRPIMLSVPFKARKFYLQGRDAAAIPIGAQIVVE